MDSKLKESFGKVLARLREEHWISQQELADHCDIERAFISRMERAISQPTITIVSKIADHFGMRPADLIDRVDLGRKKRSVTKRGEGNSLNFVVFSFGL